MGLILLFVPNLILADCVDVSRTTSYYIQGAHHVILYYRVTPLAWIPMKDEKPNGFSVQHGQKATFHRQHVIFT
jgi:hypothetical protein